MQVRKKKSMADPTTAEFP